MRKFVVSDLYGDKEMYDIIMSYLEHISLLDDVYLMINGNLITDISSEIFQDIQERIMGKGSIKIEYLGGNQELILYQNTKNEFLGDLNTYYLFSEGIYYRQLLMAHGDVPKNTHDPMKIKDNNAEVFDVVGRRLDLLDRNFSTRHFRGVLGRGELNQSFYFLIKGNTPICNDYGFFINNYEHSITIDGGCRNYLSGDSSYDHVPLLEIEEGQITIFIFNHSGEIQSGFVFDGNLKELSLEDLIHKNSLFDFTEESNKKFVKELR